LVASGLANGKGGGERRHARNDTPQRVAMTGRTRARRAGQLWLTPELEYAPYASWMVPRRVLDESQLGLFD
jgi:hypothetical protein